ncbi:hypothetical protein [Halosimplex marinum]|uniref:hypothetical protein n=1 Tax=Halosimplex marinum TaxID=3396620 RepID=UPI003F5509B3
MPAKTGGSHALAAFVSTVVGTVLSKYIWAYTPPLAAVGAAVGDALAAVGVHLSHRQTGSLVVVVGLSFVWGAVFHLTRHGEDDDRGSTYDREW